MRRVIAAIVIPIALLTVGSFIATSAEAGRSKPHRVKTAAAIDDIVFKDTWKFKGHVSSKSPKCLAGRKVTIVATAPRESRGPAPQEPFEGRTKKSGKFVVDTHQQLLLLSPYVAEVAKKRTKSGLTCSRAVSPPFNPA
jgi:hypothetical protein